MMKTNIIPNTEYPMEFEEFREYDLWTLEIDNLIKSNLSSIHILYRKFATEVNSGLKFLSKDNALSMLDKAMQKHPDTFPAAPAFYTKQVMTAFSMSKMTLMNEESQY